METHLKETGEDCFKGKENKSGNSQGGSSLQKLKAARWSFGTGLLNVDEVRDKRCTWTLKGWLRKDEETGQH